MDSLAVTAELKRGTAPGPERLLRSLVKRGLAPEDLKAAAAIALILDEQPIRKGGRFDRSCLCGCGRQIRWRRLDCEYLDGACRIRAYRKRKRVTTNPDRQAA